MILMDTNARIKMMEIPITSTRRGWRGIFGKDFLSRSYPFHLKDRKSLAIIKFLNIFNPSFPTGRCPGIWC